MNGCVEEKEARWIQIRQEKNGKKYLYDLVNVKKETSTPLKS